MLWWIPQMSGAYQDEEKRKRMREEAEQERLDHELEHPNPTDETGDSRPPAPPETPSGSN